MQNTLQVRLGIGMPYFLGYSDIKLKMFIDIANTRDYKKVLIKGFATLEQCEMAFEKIVEQNATANQDNTYRRYSQSLISYNKLLSELNVVKAYLIQLLFQVDTDVIRWLKGKNYIISTANSKEYELTIYANLRKSENLVTRLQMKVKEITNMLESHTSDQTSPTTIGSLIASVSAELGFALDENLTLAEFNEYKRIIKSRNRDGKQRAKQAGFNKR